MNSKKRKIAAGFLIVLMSIGVSLVLNFIAVKPAPKLHHHIPSGASLAVKINNSNLLHRFFFDFLYKGKLTNKDIKKLNYRANKVTPPQTGIAIDKNIIAFYEDWKEYDIIGFIFEVNDVSVYADFVKDEPNYIKSYNDEIGCIVIIPDSLDVEQRELLEFYAQDLTIKKNNPNPTRIALSKSSPKSLFHAFFDGTSSGLTQNMNIEVFVEENKLLLEGVGTTNPILTGKKQTHHYLKAPSTEDYLELNLGKLPDTLGHYFDKVLKSVSVRLPEITSQQILLYGFKILNIDGKMFVLPEFDGIFRFNENIAFKDEIQALNHYAFKPGSGSYEVEDVTYHYQQVDSNEIYVGLNPSPDFHEKQGEVLFSVSGFPASAFNIKGEGIIARIAQLVPPVQHTKHLFNSLDHFELYTELGANDTLKVSGSMVFPEDKTASIELLKFLLKF